MRFSLNRVALHRVRRQESANRPDCPRVRGSQGCSKLCEGNLGEGTCFFQTNEQNTVTRIIKIQRTKDNERQWPKKKDMRDVRKAKNRTTDPPSLVVEQPNFLADMVMNSIRTDASKSAMRAWSRDAFRTFLCTPQSPRKSA